jgi:acyl-coenzyme A synthetase/AMP-(fatty) acid ligase
VEIGDYYGLTETGGFCAGTRPSQLAGGGCLGRAVGAVVEVHVDDRRAAIGEPGEIRVSGPAIATRYVGDASLRRRDGWIHTGDRGVRGADGMVRLLGRDDGILKNRQGERVSGPEIEGVLTRHPDVRSCAVATVREVGELRAFVTVSPDVVVDDLGLVADLRALVHDALGAAKTPDRIDVVEALPSW